MFKSVRLCLGMAHFCYMNTSDHLNKLRLCDSFTQIKSTESKFTYQVFCKGAEIKTSACTHLGCFLLPQVCGHNQETSVQSRFSHLSNCRETLKAQMMSNACGLPVFQRG